MLVLNDVDVLLSYLLDLDTSLSRKLVIIIEISILYLSFTAVTSASTIKTLCSFQTCIP